MIESVFEVRVLGQHCFVETSGNFVNVGLKGGSSALDEIELLLAERAWLGNVHGGGGHLRIRLVSQY